MDKPFRRILLIKMRFHGDMLLTTPVISSLKKNYPDAKIDVLLYQDTIPILSENPEINALYGIKNKKAKASEKITNFFHLIKVLRANKYDLIVNLTDQWMVAILVRLLNARVKISLDRIQESCSVSFYLLKARSIPFADFIVNHNTHSTV